VVEEVVVVVVAAAFADCGIAPSILLGHCNVPKKNCDGGR
jgi:hypothetical protein